MKVPGLVAALTKLLQEAMAAKSVIYFWLYVSTTQLVRAAARATPEMDLQLKTPSQRRIVKEWYPVREVGVSRCSCRHRGIRTRVDIRIHFEVNPYQCNLPSRNSVHIGSLTHGISMIRKWVSL